MSAPEQAVLIRVHNRKRGTAPAEAVYIGRSPADEPWNPLSNPRRVGDPKPGRGTWERGETIEHFRRELRAVLDLQVQDVYWGHDSDGRPHRLTEEERRQIRHAMNRLYALASASREVHLVCWCAPSACHGDVVADILAEALKAAGHTVTRTEQNSLGL